MPPTAPSHPCGYARNPEPLTHSQLMVVYPASWSICIIGPAWSLIILYFAPALALWCIGTLVSSQTLPAPLGCLPNALSALRDLIQALCDHSQYSEPFTLGSATLDLHHVCLHLQTVSLVHLQHSETLLSSSKLIELCATILGLTSLMSACNQLALSATLDFSQVSPCITPKPPSEVLQDFSALFWCYASSPPLRLGHTMCLKLCRIFAMHTWITNVFASAPLPGPLASKGLGPHSG
ncbi:hypothetical protein GGX14DRAFT_554157 [Mycena pura]|uniref:Uncharacterized protein n=1 Tax=Mycena pura TaxID=153505 RepID=A0AAD6YVY2_9AGAR|nr:hypothetical protein GGX14DRAFT_554157 [Mycena pura]